MNQHKRQFVLYTRGLRGSRLYKAEDRSHGRTFSVHYAKRFTAEEALIRAARTGYCIEHVGDPSELREQPEPTEDKYTVIPPMDPDENFVRPVITKNDCTLVVSVLRGNNVLVAGRLEIPFTLKKMREFLYDVEVNMPYVYEAPETFSQLGSVFCVTSDCLALHEEE